MVHRKHILAGCCTLMVAAALSLRIWAGFRQDRLVLNAGGLPARLSVAQTMPSEAALTTPRDYVLYPNVAPGEETCGPTRIVSLAPSITETLCALGLADRLVGRTQFCSYPPQISRVPAVGGIMDTNLELIRAMAPDLVLTTSNSGDVGPKLDALGLRHESLPHDSLDNLFSAIQRAGVLCDRPETARRLVAAIQTDLARLTEEASRLRIRPMRVLMVCSELPVPPTAVWAAGPGSFLDSLLQASGHRNAAAQVLKSSYGEIPLERLVVLDPDVILTFPIVPPTASDMTQAYRSWSPIEGMQAIRQQRVRVLGGPEWLSAGPRIALELHRFITVLSEFR